MFVVTTGWCISSFQRLKSVVMGPRLRGDDTELDFCRTSHDPPLGARTHPARQDRLSDGGQRQGDHLSRTRRTLQPGRASVPRAWAESRRSCRVPDREPAGVHGDLLGGAARGAVLHRDQPLSHAGRNRLHRQGLRRARRHHLAEMRGSDQGAGQRRARRAAVLHDRRAAAGFPLLGQGSHRAAGHADRG